MNRTLVQSVGVGKVPLHRPSPGGGHRVRPEGFACDFTVKCRHFAPTPGPLGLGAMAGIVGFPRRRR
jgi:hypothetical protein